jgi:cytochrome c
MRTLFFGVALGSLAVLATGAARAQNVDELLKKHGCLACHAIDKKLVGPTYQEVAKKYAGQKDAEKMLAEKVKKGGVGVWGQVPMPPNAAVPDADIQAMVKWILTKK